MNHENTTNAAEIDPLPDDPMELVRCVAALAAQFGEMTNWQRALEPFPLSLSLPLAQAAQRLCLARGYAEDGNELPGFMERAARAELEANPTKELRALQEAMLPVEPEQLSPEQIADLAVRAGVKGSAAALAEFVALAREAQPLAPEEMHPAPVAVLDDEPEQQSDASLPKDMAQAHEWIIGLRDRVDNLLDIINGSSGGALTNDRIDTIMAKAFPRTKPTAAYREFAQDIAATVLEDAATACETKYSGMGSVPDDPHPDAVIHNSAVNECVTSIRALKGAAS